MLELYLLDNFERGLTRGCTGRKGTVLCAAVAVLAINSVKGAAAVPVPLDPTSQFFRHRRPRRSSSAWRSAAASAVSGRSSVATKRTQPGRAGRGPVCRISAAIWSCDLREVRLMLIVTVASQDICKPGVVLNRGDAR